MEKLVVSPSSFNNKKEFHKFKRELRNNGWISYDGELFIKSPSVSLQALKDLDIEHRKLFFIHIPKTSGRSLLSKQIVNLKHGFNVPDVYRRPAKLKGYHGYRTDTWPQYTYPKRDHYKITIIRNPYDLLCSYYFHGRELDDDNGESTTVYHHSGWAAVNYTHGFRTFKQFINSYCSPDFEWHQPAFKNFLFSQLFDTEGKNVADIILKYEYLDEAKEALNIRLRHPLDVTVVKNKSNRKVYDYKHYYDNEMIQMVKEKCARELEHFNYDFNGSTVYEPIIVNYNKIKYNVAEDDLKIVR